MDIEVFVATGAGVVSLIATAYGSIRSQQVKNLEATIATLQEQHKIQLEAVQAGLLEWKKTASEWQTRHEDDRKEIHAVRNEFNGELGLMRDQLESERIDNARLREQTNFAPVEKKLDVVIEEFRADRKAQASVNASFIEALTKVSSTMDVIVRLVPQVSQSILAQQEEPI